MFEPKTPQASRAFALVYPCLFAALLAFAAPPAALAGGTPATGTVADQLLMITGSESKTDDGDYLTARDGLATVHRYFIEVPATATRLKVDLFDMDLLAGAGDAAGERDRPRNYPSYDPNNPTGTATFQVFMSAVEYLLFDPDGNAVVTKRRKGTRWAPSGGDNAWLTFYDSNTASTTGATATWIDNFNTSSFSNNNGSQSFTTSWIESNETGSNSVAGPGGGLIAVTGGSGGVLRMNNLLTPFPPYTGRQPAVERELNLAGYTSATLSFSFLVPNNNEKDDILVVDLSNDGGATWTTIDDVTGGIQSVTIAATPRTYDITDFISANTRVRFRLAYLFAGSNERVDIDNLEIRATTAAPAAVKTGHWELRVDMSRAITMNPNPTVQNGDDTNAFGFRASDGDPSAAGQEFNAYSFVNTSGLDANDSRRTYRLYPLLTSGCDFDTANFDWDANLAANVAPDPDILPPFGTFRLTGRETAFTHTLSTLSNNDVWRAENVTNYTDDDDATNYGIWQADFRIDDPGDGNYVPHYYMDYAATTVTPPTSAAPANALRNYFPTDASSAPAKPYLRQWLRFKNVQPSGAADPPLVGETARYVVYTEVVNPVGSIGSITFSPTRTVTSRFPGGLLTYRGIALMTQGSIVSQPTLGSTTAGDVVWNPGVLPAGSLGLDTEALLSYEVDFTPTVSPYDVDFVGAAGSGNGTRATWLDETGYDVVGSRSIFSTGELCELWVRGDVPTPVLVSGFRAFRRGGERVVEWQTAAEAKTDSFDLYRLQGEKRVLVNSGTLTALLASPQGGTYRLADPSGPAGPADYWLVAHDTDGRSASHGPFRVEAEEQLPEGPAGDYAIAVHSPSPRHVAFEPPAPAPIAASAGRGEPAELWLETKERGLYRVGRAALESAFGLSASQLDARLAAGRFDLRRGGAQIAWTPAPGNAGLDFFAPGFENAFTATDAFHLALGDGLQMRKADGKALPLDWSGGSFRDVRHAERDLRPVVLLPLDPEGDFFFWDFVRHGTAAETRSFAFDLPSPAAGGARARLLVDLQGGAPGSHQLSVSLNGTPIGTAAVAGTAASRAELEVDPALLLPGANSLAIRATGGDLVFVQSFDLEYDRLYAAESGRLIARPDGRNLLAAGGFPQAAVRVFDLADPERPRLLTATRTVAEGGSFRVLWRPLGENDQLAVAESGVRTPVLRLDQPSQLRRAGNQADYLVIAPAALAGAAQGLAELRSARGLASQVVTVEDVYDEFAFGRRDPRAIRDFLAFAHGNWSVPPRYVVLAGHGTYDYRDDLGFHNNLIPALMWNAGDSLYPTDALYADLEGEDGRPEIALGRLPVLDAAELGAYVEKIAAYEALGAQSWQSKVLMLSDVSGPGGDFLAGSRALEPLLPAGYAAAEIALDEMAIGDARDSLFAALEQGAALVHYSGHGAVDRLSASALLTSADVAALGNGGRPTILTAATCHVGFHALPSFDSLGEELLLHPTGGAAAVFAPTWLAENLDSAYLGDRLFRQLFAGPGVILGDAVKGAAAAGAAQGLGRDLLYAYQLLGDPALLFLAEPAAPPPGCTENCGNG